MFEGCLTGFMIRRVEDLRNVGLINLYAANINTVMQDVTCSRENHVPVDESDEFAQKVRIDRLLASTLRSAQHLLEQVTIVAGYCAKFLACFGNSLVPVIIDFMRQALAHAHHPVALAGQQCLVLLNATAGQFIRIVLRDQAINVLPKVLSPRINTYLRFLQLITAGSKAKLEHATGQMPASKLVVHWLRDNRLNVLQSVNRLLNHSQTIPSRPSSSCPNLGENSASQFPTKSVMNGHQRLNKTFNLEYGCRRFVKSRLHRHSIHLKSHRQRDV